MSSMRSAYLARMLRRLSLDVGVSSSPSGSHSSASTATFFTRSTLLNRAITSSTARCSSARPRGGGADVLAPGGDDQLLLAIHDAQVAVVVEHADVARVEGAVGVEGVGGLGRVVQVAGEHVAAAAAHLAVVGQEHLDTRERAPDRAHPHG